MTYPVDDAGNVRIDFVWGHMPVQPDQQRASTSIDHVVTDGDWTISKPVGSGTLDGGWTTIDTNRSDGYQNEINRPRLEVIDYGIHDIATTGYSNYPAFIENYSGDGDTGLEAVVPDLKTFAVSAMDDAVVAAGLVYASTTTYVGATTVNDGKIKTQSPAAGVKANIGATVTATFYNAPEVPNVVGLTESAANTALVNAHVVKGAVTTANNAAGATAINDGKIKTQVPAAGTTVDTGSSVALVKYAYVAPIVSTTGPISGFNRGTPFSPLGADQTPMYLVGRTVFPAIGDTITITGASDSQFNRNWYVENVIDNDGYNTGGTAVLLTKVGATAFTGTTATGGTWTKQ